MQIPVRGRGAGRLRHRMGAATGEETRSVAEVAAGFCVSWPTTHRTFIMHADVLLRQAAPVRALGIDGTRRG